MKMFFFKNKPLLTCPVSRVFCLFALFQPLMFPALLHADGSPFMPVKGKSSAAEGHAFESHPDYFFFNLTLTDSVPVPDRRRISQRDSVPQQAAGHSADSVAPATSPVLPRDSVPADTAGKAVAPDTVTMRYSKDTLSAPVT